MAKPVTVVLSQGQSNNPAKRKLEEAIVAELITVPGIETLVIPHLYDLGPHTPAMVALQGVGGHFVLLSWLYARAAHWILDRHNVRGQNGKTALKSAWDERKKKWEKATRDYRPDSQQPSVLDQRPVPERTIYHLDLRMSEDPRTYLEEVRRLVNELQVPVVGLQNATSDSPGKAPATDPESPQVIGKQQSGRRWYPVIDFSRCTNCMECIDFCLFGVYGVDGQETILVEQPDNCRKGCPACSRICPENAIIFPQHKTPSIAGDPSIGSEMKIDLSQLFGKPSDTDLAAKERDEHLQMAGRDPVGRGSAPATEPRDASGEPNDELDELIDALDEMDL